MEHNLEPLSEAARNLHATTAAFSTPSLWKPAVPQMSSEIAGQIS